MVRAFFTGIALMTTVACSSSPPQDENTEQNVEEGEITEANTDQIPTDLTQTETTSYGLNDLTTDSSTLTASAPISAEVEYEKEPERRPAKKRKNSKPKRVLSQDTVAEAAPVEAAPAPEPPVVETPVAPPEESPPAFVPPPVVEQPMVQTPVEETPVPFYQHKFFIPGVIAALIALFFLFRRKR